MHFVRWLSEINAVFIYIPLHWNEKSELNRLLLGLEYQGKCGQVQLEIASGARCFLTIWSQIAHKAKPEAVHTNFDHFWFHDCGGITKHEFSGLPSPLKIKEWTRQDFFFFFLVDRSLKLFLSAGKAKLFCLFLSCMI